MSDVNANILPRSPIAVFPFRVYTHGMHSVVWAIFFQDPEGRIRHKGAIGEGIAVDVDRNANLNRQFAVIGWNDHVDEDNELRLYYTDKEGKIYERCYTKSRGRDWYDGSLVGQFKAAPHTNLAANSQNGERTRVYFQDPETGEIAQIMRPSKNGGFQAMGKFKAPGLKSTCIATDPGGSVEVLYQGLDNKFIHEGAQTPWVANQDYAPGASIALAGNSVSSTGGRVFTVNKNNKLCATIFDRTADKWGETAELIDVIQDAPLTANDHRPQTNPPSHGTTVFTQAKPHEILKVGFTSGEVWDESVAM